MSLPPYPGPEGPSGEEPKNPETPAEPPPGPTHQPYGQEPPAYGQPPENPYGQQPPAPYGQQPAAPYGQQPAYGQPPPYGYGAYTGVNEASRGWSGTAIAAFVTSLVCCGIPSMILGIIALFRTGEGKGKGRWMAVTGLVLGVVGIAVQAAVVFGGLWVFNNAITVDNAEVGQCADIDEEDDEVTLWKKDCDESHDAEIFGVHELTSAQADDYSTSDTGSTICSRILADEQPDVFGAVGSDYRIINLTWDEEPESGDNLVCYVERIDGDELDEKLLD